mgnify:CR=1 FL=1|jgi:hypothetical protein
MTMPGHPSAVVCPPRLQRYAKTPQASSDRGVDDIQHFDAARAARPAVHAGERDRAPRFSDASGRFGK